jgi:hexosaminidase
MKKSFFLYIVYLNVYSLAAQVNNIAIIPQPVSMVYTAGSYILPKKVVIEISERQSEVEAISKMFIGRIAPSTGYTVQLKKVQKFTPNAIHFALKGDLEKSLGKEGYRLSVKTNVINLIAAKPAGLFYGMETLMQLFTPDIESKTRITKSSWVLPLLEITDYPRFAWRGLMLDVARHFFNKQQVKSFIDDMVKYKFNLLHLHLTDDDGWRIEIKSLPKLTEVGAWRPDRTGTYTFFTTAKPEDQNNYGGFFTQEDIKEIVQYAGKHFVNVMPEIDVPGHSLAAIAAYNQLASVPGEYRPCSGDTVMVWPKDADFYARYDNSLCAGKEEVYDFLEKVFTEVAQLFPFEYIHTGGDENAKNFWEKSDLIKDLMKRENIKTMNGVQNYFSRRVEKIIEAKGKKMIGWDEILEGELNPNTAIMSWQGTKGGIEASKKKHEVVFSPTTYAYLNSMQGDAAIEPPVHSTILLKTTYETEPLPEGVDPKFVKGVQANLWTEQVYTYRHLQYMIWPRAFAIAELAWTPANRKNWPEFISRIENHFVRYNFSQTKYSPAIYDPAFNVEMGDDNVLKIKMETQIAGIDLRYSFDNSFPDNFYPEYAGKLDVPKDPSLLIVFCYITGKAFVTMFSI